MESTLARILALSVPVLLIASVVVVSLLAWAFQPLLRALMLNPYRVSKGEIHRLLSAGWVHTDASHLLFNMLTLYFFADEALRVLGTTRFLALYISAVVVAFIPTTLQHMRNPNYSSVGASGAVTAVLFSAILLNPELKLYLFFIPIPIPGVYFGLAYLIYSMWASKRSGDGINHYAHFSGAIYGALFTYVFEPARVLRTVKSFL